MLEKNQVDYVWNVDLSKVALSKARELYEKRQLKDKASFIYSDGFKNLSTTEVGDRDIVLVLAGFGSKTALSILNQLDRDWLSRRLCLISSPHTCPLPLLNWMRENNWTLIKENYFKYREKIYPIMLFSNFLETKENHQKNTDLCLEYWGKWYERSLKRNTSKLTDQSSKLIENHLKLKQKNSS